MDEYLEAFKRFESMYERLNEINVLLSSYFNIPTINNDNIKTR